MIDTIFGAFKRVAQRLRQPKNELHGMSDLELRDLGIGRSEIEAVMVGGREGERRSRRARTPNTVTVGWAEPTRDAR